MYVSLIVVVLSLALLGSNERWGGVEAVEAQPAPGIDLPNKQEELHILRTWIQDTEFTSRLPSILYQCAHPSSVEKALSAAECNVARFLHFHNSIAAPATSTPATAGTSRNLKVDSIPMDSPYPTIFEDYIAKNR